MEQFSDFTLCLYEIFMYLIFPSEQEKYIYDFKITKKEIIRG